MESFFPLQKLSLFFLPAITKTGIRLTVGGVSNKATHPRYQRRHTSKLFLAPNARVVTSCSRHAHVEHHVSMGGRGSNVEAKSPRHYLTKTTVSPLIMVRFSKSKVFRKLEDEPHKSIDSFCHSSEDKIGKIAIPRASRFWRIDKSVHQCMTSCCCFVGNDNVFLGATRLHVLF